MDLKKINWYNLFIHFVLVLLSIVVILLAKQNHALKNPQLNMLKKGDVFPALKVLTLNTSDSLLTFANKKEKSLIFIYSTGCSFCVQNIENWKGLFEKFKNKYNILAICSDSLEKMVDYNAKHILSYPTYFPILSTFRTEYKISAIPETIILSRDSKVENIWLGYLDEKKLNEVSNYLLEEK